MTPPRMRSGPAAPDHRSLRSAPMTNLRRDRHGCAAAPPPSLSPEARAYIDQQPPGPPPPDQGIGTRLMNTADAAILPADRSATTLPATGPEAATRRFVGGAETLAAIAGYIAMPIFTDASSAAAPEDREAAPDCKQSLAELAVNTIPQMVTGARASRAGPTVDAADAATMQLARSDKYKIPLNATDITPGSQYRTPASAQASVDALQRNIVSEMGENPNTGEPARPRILSRPVRGSVMDRTATRDVQCIVTSPTAPPSIQRRRTVSSRNWRNLMATLI